MTYVVLQYQKCSIYDGITALYCIILLNIVFFYYTDTVVFTRCLNSIQQFSLHLLYTQQVYTQNIYIYVHHLKRVI